MATLDLYSFYPFVTYEFNYYWGNIDYRERRIGLAAPPDLGQSVAVSMAELPNTK